MFKLEVETCGAAFRDENDNLDRTGFEVRRLMKQVSECLRDGESSGVLIDINGNKVGGWSYE